MAIYSMLLLRRISVVGMKPRATGPSAGFDSHSSTANDPAISTMSATTSAST